MTLSEVKAVCKLDFDGEERARDEVNNIEKMTNMTNMRAQKVYDKLGSNYGKIRGINWRVEVVLQDQYQGCDGGNGRQLYQNAVRSISLKQSTPSMKGSMEACGDTQGATLLQARDYRRLNRLRMVQHHVISKVSAWEYMLEKSSICSKSFLAVTASLQNGEPVEKYETLIVIK